LYLQGSQGHGKSWNLKFAFRPGKVLEIRKICLGNGKVMEFHIFSQNCF